ncbi:putative cytochrome b561, partial [Trichinella patagoniensis]
MLAVQNRRYSLEEVDARHFKKVCVVAHILAITELLLIGFWMNNFCGGFQWNGPPEAMFTHHDIQNASLCEQKDQQVLSYCSAFDCIYIFCHCTQGSFQFPQLQSTCNTEFVYSSQLARNDSNIDILHAGLNYIFGFMAYFYPGFTLITRRIYLPIHKFIGIAIFIASTGAALMGISEKAAWHIKCWSSFCSEGLLANFSGLVILFYALAVVYLVVCERFRREKKLSKAPKISDHRHKRLFSSSSRLHKNIIPMATTKERSIIASQSGRYCFNTICTISHLLGISTATLIGIWMGVHGGGFDWNGNWKSQFTFHPLFMALGLQFLFGEAILIFRMFPFTNKKLLKIGHGVLHASAMVLFAFALIAAFRSHSTAAIPDLYTFHSWIGIALVACYVLQFLFGLVIFFLPVIGESIRKMYLPIHKVAGIIMFIVSSATCLTGITEKAVWSVADWKLFSPEGLLVNFSALSLILYSISVTYLVMCNRFKRISLGRKSTRTVLNGKGCKRQKKALPKAGSVRWQCAAKFTFYKLFFFFKTLLLCFKAIRFYNTKATDQ